MGLEEIYVAKWYGVHGTIRFLSLFNATVIWFQKVRDGNGKLKQFVFCEYQCY